MDALHEKFETGLRAMGLGAGLPCELLKIAPACLRFRIGGEGSPYLADHRKPSGDYIDAALRRALDIYRRLPAAPDLLRLDRNARDADLLTQEVLGHMGLPEPEGREGDHLYWQLHGEPAFLRSLLREIIRGELDPEGLDLLCGNVYFLSTEGLVLYQLYDDRGAHVAAADKASLASLRCSCADWISMEH